MAVVNAQSILERATRGKYAVGAFNITSIVQMKGVVEAACNKKAPVIIQTSEGTAKFLTPKLIAAAYRALAEDLPVDVCLHLDHSTDVEFCKACVDAGYTSIMIDASKESYVTNIAKTREVAEYCHKAGNTTVEGELGTVVGVEDDISVNEKDVMLCDPDKALDFVVNTGIDLLAPAIGTAHGLYKNEPKIIFEILEKISKIINKDKVKAPLVIHGGTGLQVEVIKKLVELGGSKFNVSTNLKHCLIDASFNYLSNHKNDYSPGKLDAYVYQQTVILIENWIDVLGCEGKY